MSRATPTASPIAVQFPHAKRLGRIALKGISTLSLLLCMATVVLWVRSYWIEDAIGRQWNRAEQWEIASSRGQIAITHHLCFGAVTFSTGRQDGRYLDRRNPTELALQPVRGRSNTVTGAVWAGVGFYRQEPKRDKP